MHVLQLGEAEVAALDQPASGVNVDMTAQRRILPAVRAEPVGVEVLGVASQARIGQRVTGGVGWGHVVEDEVDRVDGRDTVALAHDPGTGQAADGVGGHVADVGRYHVERPARMPFGVGLEVCYVEIAAIEVDVLRVGLMHDQPHRRRGNAVGSSQQLE